ncbi:MAG: hypothetical protein DHS20C21_21180 [Gemmatimonadota bacterium]|nr:MAG: hypothetical protein DHS20C21_21180 [Gemmatimonadota bacterium]
MTIPRFQIARLAALFALGMFGAAGAQNVAFELTTGDPAVLNHWPAGDALLATGDDVVNSGPSGFNASGPNANASYSYNAFDFTGIGAASDPWMPAGFAAMTFLEGTVTIDMAVAGSGGGPLLAAWNLTGTEPFSGHGPYSSTLAAINSGTYDPGSGAFTMNVDFAADIGGTPDTSETFVMAGEAWVVDLVTRSGGTGNAYVDNILTPVAQNAGASGFVFFLGTGIVPPANNFTWGMMPVVASMFGLAPTGTPVEQTTWSGIKGLYR